MESAATYRGTVYPWQCDHVGHMNIMWYVGKFDEANWNLFARLGLTPGYLRESGRGMAAVQQNISYRRELLAGDIVEIKSALLEIGDTSIVSCTRCATLKPARSSRPAKSPAFTWTARPANLRRLPMRLEGPPQDGSPFPNRPRRKGRGSAMRCSLTSGH